MRTNSKVFHRRHFFSLPQWRMWLLIGLSFGAGCRREQRDFRHGGPSARQVNGERESKPGNDASGARGPLTAMEKNAFALSEGKRLYAAFNCVGCHSNGGGDIGPALMDRKWIYGAAPETIYDSILDGRPNGMPAFRGRINEVQARQLTAYVRSLSGQARADAATARDDHMKTAPAQSSVERVTPEQSRPQNPEHSP